MTAAPTTDPYFRLPEVVRRAVGEFVDQGKVGLELGIALTVEAHRRHGAAWNLRNGPDGTAPDVVAGARALDDLGEAFSEAAGIAVSAQW